MVLDGKAIRILARPDTEIRRFVHVDPQSVYVKPISSIEECVKLPVPVSLRFVIEPVRECGDARPDDA